MEKRLAINVPKQQINHNNNTLRKPQHKNQSASDSTSKKSLPKLSNTNPNKQNTKRLKIFTDIYNPTKHERNFVCIQTASIDSPHETAQHDK